MKAAIKLSDLAHHVPATQEHRARLAQNILNELITLLEEPSITGWTTDVKSRILQQARTNQRRLARRVAFRVLAGHVPSMSDDVLQAKWLLDDLRRLTILAVARMDARVPNALREELANVLRWPQRAIPTGQHYHAHYMVLVVHSFAFQLPLELDTTPVRDAELLSLIESTIYKLDRGRVSDALTLLRLMKQTLSCFPPMV